MSSHLDVNYPDSSFSLLKMEIALFFFQMIKIGSRVYFKKKKKNQAENRKGKERTNDSELRDRLPSQPSSPLFYLCS
jgi:hypothetical protein